MFQQSLYLASVFCLLFCLSLPTSTKTQGIEVEDGYHTAFPYHLTGEGSGPTKKKMLTPLICLTLLGWGGGAASYRYTARPNFPISQNPGTGTCLASCQVV